MFHYERKSNHRRSAALLVLGVALAISSGCSLSKLNPDESAVHKERDNSMTRERIRLNVQVVYYRPHAIHDDFIDGTSQSFGLTILMIIEPAAFNGRRLSIVHARTPSDGSIWTEVGKEHVIEMEKWAIEIPKLYIPPESIAVIE